MTGGNAAATGTRFVVIPLLLLAAALIACGAILSLPITAPIGTLYWDVFLYYDAANRIFTGQVPVVDFFAPVGPLGYYLAAGLMWLFPHGQPSLLAPWSILLVTVPLMAMIMVDVGSRSRATALALLIPFLLFSLLPFNTREFYPLPGSDAFGVYNRQSCQLLYILVATLMFVRGPRLQPILLTLVMLALFFVKITGFVSGGLVCAYALLSGRATLRSAIVTAVAFAAVAAVIELGSGLVSAYVADILLLISMNSGGLFNRIRESGVQNFDVALVGAALILLLLWLEFWVRPGPETDLEQTPPFARTKAFFDLLPFWLGVVLFAGLLFEAQNTGSQAFIFVWPVLWAILLRIRPVVPRPVLAATIATLCAAIALPPAIGITARAARVYIGGANNPVLANRNLKTLGAVNLRPEIALRAERMERFYAGNRTFYDGLIAIDEMPAPLVYNDFHFQIVYLSTLDKAIDSIRALEASRNVRFHTIMTLDFVNPLPWLMDRKAPLHISIGADPFRTVPPPGPAELAAVEAADLILYPTCPSTLNSVQLEKIYAPALTKHTRITLNACHDAYIHPKFAVSLGQ